VGCAHPRTWYECKKFFCQWFHKAWVMACLYCHFVRYILHAFHIDRDYKEKQTTFCYIGVILFLFPLKHYKYLHVRVGILKAACRAWSARPVWKGNRFCFWTVGITAQKALTQNLGCLRMCKWLLEWVRKCKPVKYAIGLFLYPLYKARWRFICGGSGWIYLLDKQKVTLTKRIIFFS
jgi:hypothetical protein